MLTPAIHPIRSIEIGLLAMLRVNALAVWGRRVYERPAMVGSFTERTQVLTLAGRLALDDAPGLLLDLARVQDGEAPCDPAGFARQMAAALAVSWT